jgi:ribosome-binding factor A
LQEPPEQSLGPQETFLPAPLYLIALKIIWSGFSMPEQRGRRYHQDRVAGTLRDEITAMIEGQLSDPRIAFAYVSQVALNPGGKSALVYITVDGGEKEEADTLAALMDARGYIRHELLERTGKRHIPDLSFQIDRSEKMKARIDELMGRQRKRQKAEPAAAAPTAEIPAGGSTK